MAVITPDTFDPLRRYVGVRLQQGVPIVDADENEREDIRQFELRAFLKWFVGDGVPEGSDAFRIEATGATNDFTIRSGITATPPPGATNADKALGYVGRCLVDGLDVIIDKDITFASQPIHASQPNYLNNALAIGADPIQIMASGNATMIVYLDVWKRLVTPNEDPTLVHPGLGTESCARVKREWAVRVRFTAGVPVPGNGDYRVGHSYYALASVVRRFGNDKIFPADVTDLRDKRLFMPPSTLITDIFGKTAAEYRRGQGRPLVSIREAINALMRGELPSSPDIALAPSAHQNIGKRAFVFDQSNGVIAFWQSNRSGGVDQIFASRIDMETFTFSAPIQITTGTTPRQNPNALMLPNGDLLVCYQTQIGAQQIDVHFKRGTLSTIAAAPEQTVVASANLSKLNPHVFVTGTNTPIVTFMFYVFTQYKWQLRRINLSNLATNVWMDSAPVDFSIASTGGGDLSQDFHGAVDSTGTYIWAAYRLYNDVRVVQLNPAVLATPKISEAIFVGSPVAYMQPFVLESTSPAETRLIIKSTNGLHYSSNTGSGWQLPAQLIPGTNVADNSPCAVKIGQDLWVFFNRMGSNETQNIYYTRQDLVKKTWDTPRPLSSTLGNDNIFPHALATANNALWVFWNSDRTGTYNVHFKRLITAI